MSKLNLKTLTPSPWKVELGAGGGGGWFPYVEERPSEIKARNDADFIELARQAFDVMVRRGWTAKKQANGKWGVDVPLRIPFDGGSLLVEREDPFTALVEAEKWYVENVE